jgi:hypothetical protein
MYCERAMAHASIAADGNNNCNRDSHMPIPNEPNKWLLTQQLDKYVYFSPLTTGSTGRAVKIHRDLFFPFFLAVNRKTLDGQLIIRTTKQIGALSNLETPLANQSATARSSRQTFTQALARAGIYRK